jgi:hypothetical protein
VVADLQVQVGSLVFDGAAQQIFDAHSHVRIPVSEYRRADSSTPERAKQADGRPVTMWLQGGEANADNYSDFFISSVS